MLGEYLRDVIARQPATTSASSARTRPPRTGCTAVFEVTDRVWQAETLATDEHLGSARPGDGGAERAPVPGLAGGLPADRAPRPVQQLRGVHPHRRLDVQPARQVAGDDAEDPLAAADRLAQLPAVLPRLAPGPQRLHPPGPRLPRRRDEQEGRRSSASTCRRTPTRCCRSPTTACAPATTSTSSWPASSPRSTWLPMDEAILALHPRHRASGSGPAPTAAPTPTSCWPAPVTSPRWRRWPPPTCSAGTCPSCGSGSSTSST